MRLTTLRMEPSGLLTACVMLALSRPSFAQCGSWYALGEGIDANAGTHVQALIVYNNELIVAGEFQSAGGQPASNIARWNGSFWQPLGEGTNDEVFTLCEFNGELIAGGNFTTAGGKPAKKVAAWNGETWRAIGEELNGGTLALIDYNKQLIAAGGFYDQFGNPYRVAKWTGRSWENWIGVNGNEAWALAIHNNDLIVGGWFSFNMPVMRWNGTSWISMSNGLNMPVNALHKHNGDLIAAGAFGGAVAKWNGTMWQVLGSGLNYPAGALATYQNELIAGGAFIVAGGSPANHIAKWNGSAWLTLGPNMDMDYPVLALTEYQGSLIAGGDFTMAGGVSANRIAGFRCPSNDLCANATLTATGAFAFNSLGASTDGPDEPATCSANGSNIQRDIWYKLLAQCTGTATVSLCGATFDTKLAVYGTCPSDSGQAVACNEDYCGSSSQVSFAATAGTLYRVRIGSATGEMGTGTMIITCTPTPPPCSADINGDQQVNVTDLLMVINTWGSCPAPCAPDINTDGTVDVADLLAVINDWGLCK